MPYTIHYGSDIESNQPDEASTIDEAIELARQSILSVIGGNAWARIDDPSGNTIRKYRYDEHGDNAGMVYEVNI